MVFDNLIIRARSLEKSYGPEQVLTDFNLDVWKGSIFGIWEYQVLEKQQP